VATKATAQSQGSPTGIRVLLVEDNPGDADILAELLDPTGTEPVELVRVERLDQAVQRLRSEHFDAVLLDLNLPDSQGIDTFTHIHQTEPGIPILVLTGLHDRDLSAQAVRQGAQDFLLKGKITGDSLTRALRYGIERHRFLADVSSRALVDELTGLLNRRGLLTLAAPFWKNVGRTKRGMMLLFIDLDGMKHINDTWGHKEGDRALVETADVLQAAFRESDLLARLGGDEFAVVAVGAPADSAARLSARLAERVSAHNAAGRRDWQLALSVGMTHCDPERPTSLEAMLARADGLMYEQKRARRKARGAPDTPAAADVRLQTQTPEVG
jgi:diguanylate cyclase (GGDEF)-like protein